MLSFNGGDASAVQNVFMTSLQSVAVVGVCVAVAY